MTDDELVFNPPPDWPAPPPGWKPPAGWTPDPSWPDPPPGWQLWVRAGGESSPAAPDAALDTSAPTSPGPSSHRDDVEPDGAGWNVAARLALLEAENAALRVRVASSGDDVDAFVVLDDERVLQEVGIYRYQDRKSVV